MVQLAVWLATQIENLNTLSRKFVPIGLPLSLLKDMKEGFIT